MVSSIEFEAGFAVHEIIDLVINTVRSEFRNLELDRASSYPLSLLPDMSGTDEGPPGPWLLMTPTGHWRELKKEERSAFATEIKDEVHNVNVLLGIRQGNVKAGRVKKHAMNHCLGRSLVWIRRTDTGEKVPIIGGQAKFFIEFFAWRRK